jgi:hypothetical protein
VTFNNRIPLRKAAQEASNSLGGYGQGSAGHIGSAHRALGNNAFDGTFGNTYHIGADRFQSGTEPQNFENIEIGVSHSFYY